MKSRKSVNCEEGAGNSKYSPHNGILILEIAVPLCQGLFNNSHLSVMNLDKTFEHQV